MSSITAAMLNTLITKVRNYNIALRRCHSASDKQHNQDSFKTVFSLPFIKYIATFNRLKVYHGVGTTAALPTCGILEMLNVFPESTFFSAAIVGITGFIMLSAASIPFRNIIGFLYITDDNKHIKISSVNFWGKRVDKIVSVDDWIPLLDLAPKKLDILYLSPHLADGSKYKLFVKFGKVLDSSKMGQVLE